MGTNWLATTATGSPCVLQKTGLLGNVVPPATQDTTEDEIKVMMSDAIYDGIDAGAGE